MDRYDEITPEQSASRDIEPRPLVATDVETPTIALVGFLGAIVIVAIIFALEVLYYRAAAAQFREKDLDQPVVELQKAVTAQQAKIAQYHWVDQAKGVVAIPIDRAMEIVVREPPSGPARPIQAVPPAAGGTGNAKR